MKGRKSKMINPQKVNPGKTYTRKEAVKEMQISEASFTKYFLGQVPEIKNTDKRVVYSGLSLNEQIDNLKSNKTVYQAATVLAAKRSPNDFIDDSDFGSSMRPKDPNLVFQKRQKQNKESKNTNSDTINITVYSVIDNPKNDLKLITKIATLNLKLHYLKQSELVDILKQLNCNLKVDNQTLSNLFDNYAQTKMQLFGYTAEYLALDKNDQPCLVVVPSLLSNLYCSLFDYHTLNKDLINDILLMYKNKINQITYLTSMQAILTDYYKQWNHINALELKLIEAKATVPAKKWNRYMKDEGLKKYNQKHISPADDLAYISDLLKDIKSNSIAYN